MRVNEVSAYLFDIILISFFVVLALAFGCLGNYLSGETKKEPQKVQKVQNDADALLPIMAGSGGF